MFLQTSSFLEGQMPISNLMVNYQMNKNSKVLLLFTLLINLVIKFDEHIYFIRVSIYLYTKEESLS